MRKKAWEDLQIEKRENMLCAVSHVTINHYEESTKMFGLLFVLEFGDDGSGFWRE